jgi:hypothetical protein
VTAEQPTIDTYIAPLFKLLPLAIIFCLLTSAACDLLPARINDYIDTDYPVRITERTNVFDTPDRGAMLGLDEQASPIAVLKPGDEVTVVGERYGKDYLAYQIRLPDDRHGYFLHRGSNVEKKDPN